MAIQILNLCSGLLRLIMLFIMSQNSLVLEDLVLPNQFNKHFKHQLLNNLDLDSATINHNLNRAAALV